MDHNDDTNTPVAGDHADPRPPKKPPAWFVHTAWRMHRLLHRLSGGGFLWTTTNSGAGAPCSSPPPDEGRAESAR